MTYDLRYGGDFLWYYFRQDIFIPSFMLVSLAMGGYWAYFGIECFRFARKRNFSQGILVTGLSLITLGLMPFLFYFARDSAFAPALNFNEVLFSIILFLGIVLTMIGITGLNELRILQQIRKSRK